MSTTIDDEPGFGNPFVRFNSFVPDKILKEHVSDIKRYVSAINLPDELQILLNAAMMALDIKVEDDNGVEILSVTTPKNKTPVKTRSSSSSSLSSSSSSSPSSSKNKALDEYAEKKPAKKRTTLFSGESQKESVPAPTKKRKKSVPQKPKTKEETEDEDEEDDDEEGNAKDSKKRSKDTGKTLKYEDDEEEEETTFEDYPSSDTEKVIHCGLLFDSH